ARARGKPWAVHRAVPSSTPLVPGGSGHLRARRTLPVPAECRSRRPHRMWNPGVLESSGRGGTRMSGGRSRTPDGVDGERSVRGGGRGGRESQRARARAGDRAPPRAGGREARRQPDCPPRAEPLRAPWAPAEPTPGRRRPVPGARGHLPRQSALGRFFTTWGWRAYAIPVLVVLTALVIADAVADPGEPGPGAEPDPGETPVVIGGPSSGPVPATGELPEGGGV